MVADQLVGPMAEVHLGELRKALDSRMKNFWHQMRNVSPDLKPVPLL